MLLRALVPVAGLKQMARNRGLPPISFTAAKGENGAARSSLRELTSGPSRLCQALGLKRSAHNGLDLLDPGSPLQVRDDGMCVRLVLVTPRIGIRHAVDLPLRFALEGHACVSGPKTIAGKCILLRTRLVT